MHVLLLLSVSCSCSRPIASKLCEILPGTHYSSVPLFPMQEFAPCSVDTFTRVQQRVVEGSKPSDHFFALTTAADLLKKTVSARKLGAARKAIVFASPFVEEVPAIPDDQLVRATSVYFTASLSVCQSYQFDPEKKPC